uniref:Uncharacterized protein n=1 Tax=Anguilla anguilla TaxID=7936 RepID=A0A0E9T082_ANGAN
MSCFHVIFEMSICVIILSVSEAF